MHSLHVVHVGVMGNIHYKEILDWLLGWFGADISKDDTESLAEREREAPQKAPQPGQPGKSPKARPLKVRVRAFSS